MSRKHYSDYYKDGIAQLERELQIVSRAAVEAERHSAACLSPLGEEKRRRRAAESEVEHLRCQNAELTARAALWKNDEKSMHAELERMNTLSEAYTVTRQRIK